MMMMMMVVIIIMAIIIRVLSEYTQCSTHRVHNATINFLHTNSIHILSVDGRIIHFTLVIELDWTGLSDCWIEGQSVSVPIICT